MNGEDEGKETKLDVGGILLITVDLHKTNGFLKKLTERTVMINGCIFKGLE
jgi:hypothetical protein